MTDFAVAIGLVLVIEGAFYAAVPSVAKMVMRQGIAASENVLRIGGLIALVAGVALVWIVKASL